jgi:hypothetical protein
MQQFEMTPAIAWLESAVGMAALGEFSVAHPAPMIMIKQEFCWCMDGSEPPPIRKGKIEPDHYFDSPANTEFDDTEDELELNADLSNRLSRWYEEDVATANATSPLLNNF